MALKQQHKSNEMATNDIKMVKNATAVRTITNTQVKIWIILLHGFLLKCETTGLKLRLATHLPPP